MSFHRYLETANHDRDKFAYIHIGDHLGVSSLASIRDLVLGFRCSLFGLFSSSKKRLFVVYYMA